MASSLVLLFVFITLALFEGLLIMVIINWPSLLQASKSNIEQALYASSPEASAVYHLFQPTQTPPKLLFIAVLTHASRRARRDAIRDTWGADCIRRHEVFCGFFTDRVGLDNDTNVAISKENEEHNDLVFIVSQGKSSRLIYNLPEIIQNVCLHCKMLMHASLVD